MSSESNAKYVGEQMRERVRMSSFSASDLHPNVSKSLLVEGSWQKSFHVYGVGVHIAFNVNDMVIFGGEGG